MIKTRCRCGAKYAFEDASSGKRAKCKKCGDLFTVEPPPDDDGPIDLAPEPGFYSEFAAAADRERANRPRQRTEGDGGMGYEAVAASMLAASRMPDVRDDDDGPGARGYAPGLLWALLFPSSFNNAVIFCIVFMAMAVCKLILSWAPCIGFIGQLIIIGWFCAFRFQVIADAANGDEDLPTLAGGEGALEDIVLPLLRWVGCWMILLAPALVFLALFPPTALLAAPPPTSLEGLMQLAGFSVGGFAALLALGLFCWPMLALCVAIGGFATLTRVDLMLVTMFRTFPIYLLTVGLVVILDAVPLTAHYFMPAANPAGGFAAAINAQLATGAVIVALDVYTEIVAAKVIGLYYRHFKQRFAWSWG
jgi:hypothetical protein